mmetsp:Transcript_18910/g.18575  ORF Transcript_18910/g.18575 Transcript_18910/m.18575 type:complete len:102 (+) Transcript_18910:3-308(+)
MSDRAPHPSNLESPTPNRNSITSTVPSVPADSIHLSSLNQNLTFEKIKVEENEEGEKLKKRKEKRGKGGCVVRRFQKKGKMRSEKRKKSGSKIEALEKENK